jgi:hypothetical protein
MRCIFCGEPADEIGKRDWDGTVTRCASGHTARFISISDDRVAVLNNEQRYELTRAVRRLPDGSFEVPSDRFRSIEQTY